MYVHMGRSDSAEPFMSKKSYNVTIDLEALTQPATAWGHFVVAQ